MLLEHFFQQLDALRSRIADEQRRQRFRRLRIFERRAERRAYGVRQTHTVDNGRKDASVDEHAGDLLGHRAGVFHQHERKVTRHRVT